MGLVHGELVSPLPAGPFHVHKRQHQGHNDRHQEQGQRT